MGCRSRDVILQTSFLNYFYSCAILAASGGLRMRGPVATAPQSFYFLDISWRNIEEVFLLDQRFESVG